MALPSNPQTLANYDITKGDQAKVFVKKVSDLFLAIAQTLSPLGLAAILNGAASLFNSALVYESVDLGVVTTNQTVDCVNATGVAVSLSVNSVVTITLSLTHLALGVPVTIAFTNTSGSNRTLLVNATQPGGTAYAEVLWKTSAASVNMTSTGLAVSTGGTLVASGAATPQGSWVLWQVAN